MSAGSNHLDPNRPDAVRLSVSEGSAFGEGALARGRAVIAALEAL
jgi:hypothetical protein